MASIGYGLDALEKTFQTIETKFDESWNQEHDRAMSCLDLEEGIATIIAPLDEILRSLASLDLGMAAGNQFDLDQLVEIREICRICLVFRERILEKLVANERAGFDVAKADELTARLRKMTDVAESIRLRIARALFRLAPDQATAVPEADRHTETASDDLRLIDLPLLGPRVRVRAREGDALLPDPPWETPERSSPFDLPLYGPRVRVKARPGRLRLPDPIDG